MKLCIVSHEYEPFPGGGIATYHAAAARILAEAGHEVHFVTNAAMYGSSTPSHAQAVHCDRNLTVHRLPHFDEGRKIAAAAELYGLHPANWRGRASAWAVDASTVAAANAAAYVRDLHARVGLDVIESPEFFAEAYFMIRARRSGRLGEFPPICVHAHTSSRQAYRINCHYWELGSHPHRAMMAREEYCLQNADALLLPSRSLLSIYESEFGEALPKARAVVPYFFDLPTSHEKARLPEEVADGGPFLLCVGRLEPRKGSDLVVRAFAELGRERPDLKLVFLGREMWHHGESFDDVLRAVLPPELRARVVRPGNLPRDQVMACMAAATAFLHPAPWDNYPCATLEAMSSGAVCVVSDRGGQVEMMEPGISGLLHRSEDVADLVATVRSVLDGSVDVAAMRRAARARAAIVTDKARLLEERQRLWDEMAEAAAAGKRTTRRSSKSASDGPTVIPGKGIVLVDAGGVAQDRFDRTRDALQAGLRLGSDWRVEVMADPEQALSVPAGWRISTTIDAVPWNSMGTDHAVVWLTSGVEIDVGRLAELVRLARADERDAGAFAWLRCEPGATFPWAPDFGSQDFLVEGRPLPLAFVTRASHLQRCRSLSGLGSAPARLASLIACAIASSGGWFRHTSGPIGRFLDEPPVVTEDLQCRVLGLLDAVNALPSGVTMVGAADGPPAAKPVAPVVTLPRWLPPAGEVGDGAEVAAGTVGGAAAVAVASMADLGKALSAGAKAFAWMLRTDNWFDLRRAAGACASAGATMSIQIATEASPLAEAPEADLVAAYQCIRDWWPELTGGNRPKSLHEEAYNVLAAQLRDLVMWRADCTVRNMPDGQRALAFPGPEHELMAADAEALRLLRPFFAATGSPALAAFLASLAGREDLDSLATAHAWVRLALLHRSWEAWDPRSHRVLHAIYENVARRTQLLAQEAKLCQEAGLRWWWDSVWSRLGLERAFDRRAPFSVRSRKRTVRKVDRPQVTVLIPAFKHEKFVAEAIRSVLAQTQGGVVALVVDDRSPDGTVAAARSVADARVSVVENETNKGLGNSILDALQRVETPYVAILNSDDVFHPKRLEVCVGAMADDPSIDLVCTALHLVDRDGGAIDSASVSAWHDGRNVHDWVGWYERTRPEVDKAFHPFRELLRRNFLITSSNVVCRTEWLRAQSATLTGLKYCLDWQLFLTASMRGRMKYVDQPLLSYRLHPSNTVWFDRASRWAYTLEVNRVAAAAVHEHRQLHPERSEEASMAVLRDLLLGLRDNTEVDWRGMLANELIGGAWLEGSSRQSTDVAALLRELLDPGPAVANEARRALALESKARAQGDALHTLRTRLRWLFERLAATKAEMQELRHALDRATIEAKEAQHSSSRAAEASAAELAKAQEVSVRHTERADELARRLVAAEQSIASLDFERAGLHGSLAESRSRIVDLEDQAASLGTAAAAQREHLARLAAELAAQAAELERLRARLDEAAGRERELVESRGRIAAELGEARAEGAALRQEVACLEDDRYALRAERAALQSAANVLRRDVARLESDGDALRAERAALHSAGSALRQDVARLESDGDALRAERAALQSAGSALRQDVARLEADGCSLRAALAALRRELANVVAMLSRASLDAAAERRRAQQAWAEGAAVRAELAIALAQEQAQRTRDETEAWSIRGFRIRPGTSTRTLLRRASKWLRKLRSPLVVGSGVDLRARVDLLHLAQPGSDASTIHDGEALRDCRLLRMQAADANAPLPAVAADVVAFASFPDRGPKLLRRMAGRRGLDGEAIAAWLQLLAARAGRDAATILAEVAHAALELQARPGVGLVTSGALAWQACMGEAARLSGRPWISVVDEVAAVVPSRTTELAAQLGSADLVIARSNALADRLAAIGVDSSRTAIDLASPASGLFKGPRDPGLVFAIGEFESPWIWDYCISGFLAGAASDQRLRVVGKVRPDSPASRAAESVARRFAERAPQRVTVTTRLLGDMEWQRSLAGDAPHAMVWIPPDAHRLASPEPAILAAIVAGVSILPVEGPTTAAFFGAMGLETWIPRTGILDCADVFRRSCRGAGRSLGASSFLAAGLSPLLAGHRSGAARSSVGAIVRRLSER